MAMRWFSISSELKITQIRNTTIHNQIVISEILAIHAVGINPTYIFLFISDML
jgi:hypothetical protein